MMHKNKDILSYYVTRIVTGFHVLYVIFYCKKGKHCFQNCSTWQIRTLVSLSSCYFVPLYFKDPLAYTGYSATTNSLNERQLKSTPYIVGCYLSRCSV